MYENDGHSLVFIIWLGVDLFIYSLFISLFEHEPTGVSRPADPELPLANYIPTAEPTNDSSLMPALREQPVSTISESITAKLTFNRTLTQHSVQHNPVTEQPIGQPTYDHPTATENLHAAISQVNSQLAGPVIQAAGTKSYEPAPNRNPIAPAAIKLGTIIENLLKASLQKSPVPIYQGALFLFTQFLSSCSQNCIITSFPFHLQR